MAIILKVKKKLPLFKLWLQKKLCIRPRSLCLIVACPRSGSTALGNWLSKQSSVVYAHQSRALTTICRYINDIDGFKSLHANRELLFQLANEIVWQYYSNSLFYWNRILVDKENFDPTGFPDERYGEFLETVQSLFPDIKIIFIVRDPVATIWSMCQKKWWGYTLTRHSLVEFSLDKYIDIWNHSAKLVPKYRCAKNVYVCKFENLVDAPEKESENIFRFLGILGGRPFYPKATAKIDFDQTEKQYILDNTGASLKEMSL